MAEQDESFRIESGELDMTEKGRERSPQFVTHYVNQAQIFGSVFDVHLLLAEIVKREDGVFVEEKVALSMSPQFAKALLLLIGNNIKRYEEQFGKLPLLDKSTSATPPETVKTP